MLSLKPKDQAASGKLLREIGIEKKLHIAEIRVGLRQADHVIPPYTA
ncbi:MAG: hypothetical protein QXI18_00235 [Nitrososphaerota archaeon]